jgi:hypothetical protein
MSVGLISTFLVAKRTLVGLPQRKNRFRYACGPMLNRWQDNLLVRAL